MVFTCFLFIQNDNCDAILSICLDAQGHIEQPLQKRSIDDIQALQVNAKTIIVLSAIWCGIHQVELPLLSETKVRTAIPFALEDQLVQPVSQMHFGFDRAYYHNGRYHVVVIDKKIMIDWMAKLQELGLNYDAITLDWFALQSGEGVVGETSFLMFDSNFQGSVSADIWEQSKHFTAISEVQWHAFPESFTTDLVLPPALHAESLYQWFAERLFKTKIFNLCQGEFQHTTSQTQVKSKYQVVGLLAGIGLGCYIAIHAGLYLYLQHQIRSLDQGIAQSYRIFFPTAKQIISPKFRVAQLLKQNQLGQNSTLWSLLENWSLALQEKTRKSNPPATKSWPEVQTIQFQNQILTLMLRCENFATLEQIETSLRTKHIHVQQISAATEQDQVVAKLELSL